MEITVIQKSTNSWLVLSFDEFKKRFKIEFMCAYQEYICHETEKIALLPEFMRKNLTEADFLLNLVWNFNNYSSSDWYICSIRQYEI